MIPEKIKAYIDYVRSGERPMCVWQLQLVNLVERAFLTEDIRLDEKQASRYLGLQKHFPYRLLLWEEFCTTAFTGRMGSCGGPGWPLWLAGAPEKTAISPSRISPC